MMDLFFFLKTLMVTALVILALQLQVGQRSLEQHAMMFVNSSSFTAPLNQAAKGGAKLIRESVAAIHSKISSKESKNPNEEKRSRFRFSWDSNNSN